MEQPSRVLLVDSDADARRRVVESLAERPVVCREVASAGAALDSIREQPPDLIVLEGYLPDLSGLGLCRLLRESPESSRIPILMVTAQASEIDRVLAFEAGADDVLGKPFYPPELAARVSAVLRSMSGARRRVIRPAPETNGEISVDPRSGLAEVFGARVDLTPKEFELLSALVSHPGRVLRRQQLIERVWGVDAPQSDRAVDAHIKSLRRKLGGARHRIETVRGVGYRFCEAAARAS